MDRFFCPDLPRLKGDLVDLPDDEAHHVSRVLRKQSGDEVELFDGQGRSAIAVLVEVRKKGVTAELAGDVVATADTRSELVIATAVPKADRFKWLVEKATELGVTRVVPMECERSVVHPGGSKLDRLRASVIAACKQCGRNSLMEISDPLPFSEVMAGCTSGLRFIADVPVDQRPAPPTFGEGNRIALIGPEGGWTDRERANALEAGFVSLSLGPHILRTETAVIAAAAVLSAR